MTADLRFAHYDCSGGREAMLRFGPEQGPTVLVALPLFEEANRTRALMIATLRGLAGRGIGGALPDLPGQGDSLTVTRAATLPDWRAALACAAAALPAPIHVVAIRGGALLDGEVAATSRWHLAPIEGSTLMRELHRVRRLAEAVDDSFGGNELGPSLVSQLELAEPVAAGPRRVVELGGGERLADAILPFASPWRTAEPHRHDALAEAMVDDIARWIAACAA